MTDVETDRGFTGLVWRETHVRGQYEAYHAGCRYRISADVSHGYPALYALLVVQPDESQMHRLYKTMGTARACATKLAQRLQWRFRGEYWDRVIAEQDQGSG